MTYLDQLRQFDRKNVRHRATAQTKNMGSCSLCSHPWVREKAEYAFDEAARTDADRGSSGPETRTSSAVRELHKLKIGNSSSLCSSPFSDEIPSSDFAERVAILIEDGGHDPAEAHRLAIQDLGGDRLAGWLLRLDAISDDRLRQVATTFLQSPWAGLAVSLGWDDSTFLASSMGPRRSCGGAAGLIPTLAWSNNGARLAGIEKDRAIIKAASGSWLNWQRQRAGRPCAVPVT